MDKIQFPIGGDVVGYIRINDDGSYSFKKSFEIGYTYCIGKDVYDLIEIGYDIISIDEENITLIKGDGYFIKYISIIKNTIDHLSDLIVIYNNNRIIEKYLGYIIDEVIDIDYVVSSYRSHKEELSNIEEIYKHFTTDK